MDAGLQADLNATIAKLYKVEPHVRKTLKRDLGEASKILVSAIKAKTPVGKKPHGKYKPGNLKRSIRKLPLRRSRSSVLVGPISRGGPIDGFYAKFLEFGTQYITPRHFIRNAEATAGPQAQTKALELLKQRIEDFKTKNSV